MYASTVITSLLAIAGTTLAAPLTKRADITIEFIGGPASYTMTIPNDDAWHPTNSDLNISKIKSSVNVISACQFQTNPPPAVAATATYVQSDDGAVDVGPPQPILAVKCPGA